MGAPPLTRWTADDALAVVRQVADVAQDYSVEASVVAVDLAGQVLVVRRHEGAPVSTVDAARRKAVTAVSLRMTTQAVAQLVSGDPVLARALDAQADLLAVPGGAPVVVDGRWLGAVGVAGGHYSQDHTIVESVTASGGTP